MNQDEQLLADIPDFLSIHEMLKATPSEEGGERFIYLEASNEGVDQQGERVLAKALSDSASHFLKFGNIDLDHYTIIGARMGLANPMAYEVGRPVDVTVRGDRTFVKAQLYRGTGELAKNANMVWESMTQLNPPARWYPSVGGSVLAKSVAMDADGGKVGLVTKVRWTNIALSRTPVNQHLPAAGTVPLATFAKSLGGLVMSKSLAAGYGTDMATLTGGDAIRMQSLDGVPQSYFDFRESMSGSIRSRDANNQSRSGLVAYSSQKFNLSAETAAEWVDRFLSDLKKHQFNRSNP